MWFPSIPVINHRVVLFRESSFVIRLQTTEWQFRMLWKDLICETKSIPDDVLITFKILFIFKRNPCELLNQTMVLSIDHSLFFPFELKLNCSVTPLQHEPARIRAGWCCVCWSTAVTLQLSNVKHIELPLPRKASTYGIGGNACWFACYMQQVL